MATKVYINEETTLVWTDTTGDYGLTLNNLATVSGRTGARGDLGAAPRSYQYAWRFTCQFDTQPAFGEAVGIYLATSDGTNPDGEVGTADAALASINKLDNLYYIGSLIVDLQTATVDQTVSGVCTIPVRYVSPVIWNGTVDALEQTNNVSSFSLTPIPFESQ